MGTGMILLLVFLVLIAIAIRTTFVLKKSHDDRIEALQVVCTIVGFVGTAILLLGMGIERTSITSSIVEFKEKERTITYARLNSEDHENNGITELIANRNGWLEKAKVRNENWDLWVPDEILSLKPMK